MSYSRFSTKPRGRTQRTMADFAMLSARSSVRCINRRVDERLHLFALSPSVTLQLLLVRKAGSGIRMLVYRRTGGGGADRWRGIWNCEGITEGRLQASRKERRGVRVSILESEGEGSANSRKTGAGPVAGDLEIRSEVYKQHRPTNEKYHTNVLQ